MQTIFVFKLDLQQCIMNLSLHLVCLQEVERSLLDDSGMVLQRTMLLNEKAYFYAGNLIAMTILQGGSSPCIFSINTYLYLSHIVPSPDSYVLPDSFLQREEIKQVKFLTQIESIFSNLLCDMKSIHQMQNKLMGS